MRRSMISALVLGAGCAFVLAAASGEASDLRTKLLPQLTPLAGLPLTCLLDANGVISIRNSSDQTVVTGRPMHWKTAIGEQGDVTLPFPFDPGKTISVARVRQSPNCSAWADPQLLELSQ